MRIRFTPFVISIITSISVCSCSEEQVAIPNATDITISANIKPNFTKADISADGSGVFVNGDEIYVIADNEFGRAESWYSYAAGNWNAKNTDTRILWKNINNSNADFHAFFCCNEANAFSINNDIPEFPANPHRGNQAYDILKAQANGVNWGATVNFSFYHAMSKITVIATSDNLDLENAVFSIEDAYLNAKSSSSDLFVLEPSEEKGRITFSNSEETHGTASAIFVPQTISGVKILTSANNTFEYKGFNDAGITINEGEHLIITMKLVKGEVIIEGLSIAGWQENNLNADNVDETVSLNTIIIGSNINSEFVENDEILIHNGGYTGIYKCKKDYTDELLWVTDSPLFWGRMSDINGKYPIQSTFIPQLQTTNNQQRDILSAYSEVEEKYSSFDIKFTHATASFEVEIALSEGLEYNYETASIKVIGASVEGEWYLGNGAITPRWVPASPEITADVTLTNKETTGIITGGAANNRASAQGLFISQDISKIAITLFDNSGERVFEYIPTDDISLTAGYNTKIVLTLRPGEVVLGFDKISIEPWVDKDPIIVDTPIENN